MKRLTLEAHLRQKFWPLLPDLLISRLRQSPTHVARGRQQTAWLLPLTTLGALALGAGIASAQDGTAWLLLGAGCLLSALFMRHR